MKPRISLVDINELKTHENVIAKRVRQIAREITAKKIVINPVVADKKTKVILDGHHRVAALKLIGAKCVPVYLVDYKSDAVKVCLRRKNLLSQILKKQVLVVGKSGNNFPVKTTRHYIYNLPKNINVNLSKLLI
jgi:hypothetical protein